MVRISMNPWLGVVLTLCLVIASLSLLSTPASAAWMLSTNLLSNPDPASSGGSPAGDPDVPMGPGDGRSGVSSRSFGAVRAGRTVSTQEVGRAGDVITSDSVVTIANVRLLLLSLRGLYLGF